jgi:hypothetical protein
MPLRLRNPLHGPLKPGPLAKRITDFILTFVALVFLAANKRLFEHMLARYAGVRDARRLPNAPRRLARILCLACTAFLFLALICLFASSWNVLFALALAVGCYVGAARTLSNAVWGAPAAFGGHGYLTGVLRRTWRVIRHGAP